MATRKHIDRQELSAPEELLKKDPVASILGSDAKDAFLRGIAARDADSKAALSRVLFYTPPTDWHIVNRIATGLHGSTWRDDFKKDKR